MKDLQNNSHTWLVSACLLGNNCRYNAQMLEKQPHSLLPIFKNAQVVPICPEMAGGLPTPRPAAKIHGASGAEVLDGTARVMSENGQDVTLQFLQGANIAVKAAVAHGATHACLKARSPSCGIGQTHTNEGMSQAHGVTAEALARAGVQLFTDEELARAIDDECHKGHEADSLIKF